MDMYLIQRQTQTVSPQLAQTMKLLQMNAMELKEYLENISMENPVVELEMPKNTGDDDFLNELQWMLGKNRESVVWEENDTDSERQDMLSQIAVQYREEESLAFFLRCQLTGLRLPPETERAARWIIANLDENGWFVRTPDDPFDRGIEAEALRAVQSLEPAGVGARDLRECLLLQMERQPGDHKLAAAIVSDHLEDIAKSHFNRIARHMGVSQEKVRWACGQIAALNPKPARDFDLPRSEGYIYPDIIIARDGEKLSIHLMEQDIPVLHLNRFYCDMLKEQKDADTSSFLQEKVRQARWLRQSISQRRNTILRCVEVIIDIQRSFFLAGGELVPMTLRDVAERADVHESTVSRAVRGKYLQCSYGLFPLSHFFPRSLPEDTDATVTVDTVKERLAGLISEENKRKPLSDQQLCELLIGNGMTISRRTVAKYRTELGIPPATGRREL